MVRTRTIADTTRGYRGLRAACIEIQLKGTRFTQKAGRCENNPEGESADQFSTKKGSQDKRRASNLNMCDSFLLILQPHRSNIIQTPTLHYHFHLPSCFHHFDHITCKEIL
jgi:hypothetical protein